MAMGCRSPNECACADSFSLGLRRTLTLTFACHEGHDYGGGLIETPQSGGAPWSQISLLCIAMFTYRILLMYRLPPPSLAIRFPVSLS